MRARGRAKFGKGSRVKKLGNWKGKGMENTFRGKDPEGDNRGLGELVRVEGKQGERDGGRGGKRSGANRWVLFDEQRRVAALSVGGGRPERPLRKKREEKGKLGR